MITRLTKQVEAKDDVDIERLELKIQSSQAALSIVDDLNSFCKTLGGADSEKALNFVTRFLETLRLRSVLQKKLIILIKLCKLILLNTSHMEIVISVSCISLMTYSRWRKLF